MKITTLSPSGETPRATDNLLTANDATFAQNTKLENGDLRSWREPSLAQALDDTTVTSLNEYGGSFIMDEDDVNYVRSPIANDQYERLYFTGKTEPRVYVNDIDLPGYYKLGVPAPTVQPDTELLTGGSGSNEDRRYAYCRVTKYGEEGPPSDASDLPVASYKDDDEVGVFKIEAIPSGRQITILRLYRSTADSTDSSVFRFVKDYDIPTIQGDWESGVSTADNGEYWQYDDGTDDIIYKCINDGTTCDPDDAVNGVGGSGTDYWEYYELVDDVDTADLSLDVCPSENWLPPPTGLKGLIGLQNGMFFGFDGNEIYPSEPYLPHAWPDVSLSSQYQVKALGNFGSTVVVLTDAYPLYIVGDTPETLQLIDIKEFLPCASKRSTVSAKSGVMYASSYGWAIVDQDGARLLSAEKITKDTWDALIPVTMHAQFYNDKYFCFNSVSGSAFVYDITTNTFSRLSDVVYAAYVSIDSGRFFVVVKEYEDPDDDTTDLIYKIKQWEGESYNYMQYTWTSKWFMLGGKMRFAVARVTGDWEFYNDIADAIAENETLAEENEVLVDSLELEGSLGEAYLGKYTLAGNALNSIVDIDFTTDITFSIFVDDESTARFTKTVKSNKPFKLPSKFKYRKIQYSLTGYLPVQSVDIATGMIEL